jgi:hypothetical protein
MKSVGKMIIWHPMADLPVWRDVLEDTYYVFWDRGGKCDIVHTGRGVRALRRDWVEFRSRYASWAVLPTPTPALRMAA